MLDDKDISLRLVKNCIVLFGWSIHPKTGLRMSTSPFYKLPKIFDRELVEKIRYLLNTNGDRFDSIEEDLKKETGFTLQKLNSIRVKDMGIHIHNNRINFTPWTKKVRGGFIPSNNTLSLEINASDQEIIDAIKITIDQCA